MPRHCWNTLVLGISVMLTVSPCAEAQNKPLTDLYGDALPPGATTRLGTTRFRNSNRCESLAYTPDGRLIIGGGLGGVVVWEATSGKEIRRLGTELPHPGGTASLSTDGKLVAIGGGCGDGTEPGGGVYEVATGRLVYRFGTESGVTLARFSPDGTVLATYGSELRIELHDAATGKRVRRLEGHRNAEFPHSSLGVVNVIFTPDSKRLISAGADGTIRVWNVATGKQEIEMTSGSDRIDGIALSPDGAVLASQAWIDVTEPKDKAMGRRQATIERCIRLWDPRSGNKIRQIESPAGEQKEVSHVGRLLGFAPDGKAVLAAANGILAWDQNTGKFLRRLAEDGGVSTIAFAPDGKTFAVCKGPGRALQIHDCATGRAQVRAGGHSDAIDSLAVSPDGRFVASAGGDRAVYLWDTNTGKQLRRLTDTEGYPAALVFSPNAQLLVSATRNRLLAWDPMTVREPRLLEPDAAPSRVVFSHDGKLLACVTGNGKAIQLLDAATGTGLRKLDGMVDKIEDLGFARDDRALLTVALKPQRVYTWDIETGVGREKRYASLPEDCYVAAISADGKLGAFATEKGPLVVIDLAVDKEVCRIAAERFFMRGFFPIVAFPQRLMRFAPDGRTLAWTVPHQRAVCLAEIATGKERRCLAGHRGHVTTLAFSATGTLLVTGSDDTTCLVWDLMGAAGWAEPPGPLSDASLAACWDDLRSDDAARAYRALRRLLAEPARAVPFLGLRLRPSAAPDKKHLAQLVADLDSDEFDKRDVARQELERLGDVVLPAVRQVFGNSPSLEMRRRVEQLIELHETLRGETLRTVRAVETLEYVATPPARQLLQTLAKGAPGARLTREAQASLDRLKMRAAVVAATGNVTP